MPKLASSYAQQKNHLPLPDIFNIVGHTLLEVMSFSATELAKKIKSHICVFQSDVSETTRSEGYDSSSVITSFSTNTRKSVSEGKISPRQRKTSLIHSVCIQDPGGDTAMLQRKSSNFGPSMYTTKPSVPHSVFTTETAVTTSSFSMTSTATSLTETEPIPTESSGKWVKTTMMGLLCPCATSGEFPIATLARKFVVRKRTWQTCYVFNCWLPVKLISYTCSFNLSLALFRLICLVKNFVLNTASATDHCQTRSPSDFTTCTLYLHCNHNMFVCFGTYHNRKIKIYIFQTNMIYTGADFP